MKYRMSWPEAIVTIAILAFWSFMCTHGWGLLK